MAKTAKIVNKTLQLALSSYQLGMLAVYGKGTYQVVDMDNKYFGEMTITLTPLARAACLEHMDEPVPPQLMDEALEEQDKPRSDT